MSSGGGSYRTYLSRSSITLGILNSVSKLTGNITGLSQQNYPRIATDGKAAAIVWKQTISGSSQLPILFTNDITKGFTSVYDTVDLNDITNTDVAMNNGKIFVVWEDDNSVTVKYRSGTYTPSSTGIISPAQGIVVQCFPNPATNLLSIRFNDLIPFAEIKILNVLGETVLNQYLTNTENAEINLSGLVSGHYFVQIQSDQSIYTSKIIKF